MMDAQTQINAILRSANFSPDDATEAARTVDQLGNVIASSHLMASEMSAALSANSSDTLEAIEKEFKATQASVKSTSNCCPDNSGTKALRDAALKLLALGEGKAGVFKLRQKELDANDYGQIILEETRKLDVGLGISVQQLVRRRADRNRSLDLAGAQGNFARDHGHARAGRPHPDRIRAVRLALCRRQYPEADRQPATLDAAVVRRRPGDGNLSLDQHDEIAAMANSLKIFRESMIEARALAADQDKDRIAKAGRASRMETRIVEFEATVRTALDSLQKSANSMQTTAQNMSTTADQSSALVNAVASAAEETSVNVQTVSSGTEELSTSISEIGRQVVASAQIARKAVDEAGAPTPPCRVSPKMPNASASWST